MEKSVGKEKNGELTLLPIKHLNRTVTNCNADARANSNGWVGSPRGDEKWREMCW